MKPEEILKKLESAEIDEDYHLVWDIGNGVIKKDLVFRGLRFGYPVFEYKGNGEIVNFEGIGYENIKYLGKRAW